MVHRATSFVLAVAALLVRARLALARRPHPLAGDGLTMSVNLKYRPTCRPAAGATSSPRRPQQPCAAF